MPSFVGYKFNDMIDFIKAIKSYSDKDTINWHHLQHKASYDTGWSKYSLKGCRELDVWIHSINKLLRLEGSIAYYWHGHNYRFTKTDFREAMTHIGRLIGVDMWKAMVEVFEYGIVMPVEKKPKDYIRNHSALPSEKLVMNEKPKDKGTFRWWEEKKDKWVALKMYDVGKNIKQKQTKSMMVNLSELGWCPDEDYLKFEAQYLKPDYLNKGKGLELGDLVNSDWDNVFKEDLYVQYKRLLPMRSIIYPNNKKDLCTADILALSYAEEVMKGGTTIEGLRKALYARINSIPKEILSKQDKDARKRQIKALLGKLKESEISEWDLSEKIQQVLCVDEE